MTKTRAAICHEFGKPLVIETITLGAPNFGEVEVALKACAICHSDIVYIDGGWGGDLPMVVGHEAAGHITRVGEGVSQYRPGDKVIVTLIRSCGSCAPCGAGMPTRCATPDKRAPRAHLANGTPVTLAMSCGAFSEHVVVDQSQIAHIPQTIPMPSAALISCGVLTGLGAVVNSANLRVGQSVVIIGIGGVGLNAIQGARIAGAARIIAVDIRPEKLNIAQEFGATDGFLATQAPPWEKVHTLTRTGADAVIVTVGSDAAFQSAPQYLRPGGKVVLVGMPNSGQKTAYEMVNIVSAAQSMVGTKMGDVVLPRDIPWIIDLYTQGRLELDALVSACWPLEQINEAIADTKTGRAKRNVVVF